MSMYSTSRFHNLAKYDKSCSPSLLIDSFSYALPIRFRYSKVSLSHLHLSLYAAVSLYILYSFN